MKKIDYLIVGNGIAGLSAAKSIRRNDKDGSIMMLSQEAYNTYYRIKLTALIAEDYTNESVLVNKDEWYEDNNIEVLLNTKACEFKFDEKKIVLDNGEEILYNKILLAMGSRSFVPPFKGREKEGVFALRTLDELTEMKDYLSDREEVAVIGGGLLGLEAAWSLKELGKKVHVIETGDGLLRRQLDEGLSDKLAEEIEARGISVHLNVGTDEIVGDKEANGIKLSNGETLNVDAILISTGVRPILDGLEETGLKIDRGVVVNNKLETNLEDVYAAGDIAQIGEVNLGLWTASMEQGRIVGSNMTADEKTYDIPKLFASLNIGDIQLFSAGKTDDATDKVYECISEENCKKIFVEDGKLVGAILYGDTKDMNKFRTAVFARENLNDFLSKHEPGEDYICR